MKNIYLISLLFSIIAVSGCSHVVELSKTLWGSSTRALEKARENADDKTFECSIDECFDAALSLAKEDEAQDSKSKKVFDLFLVNRQKQHIVVMGVPGSVNTTEVGVFFVDAGAKATRVEVSSLSSNARQRVSEIIFKELEEQFK